MRITTKNSCDHDSRPSSDHMLMVSERSYWKTNTETTKENSFGVLHTPNMALQK